MHVSSGVRFGILQPDPDTEKQRGGAEEPGGVDAVDAVGWVTSGGARRAVPPGALEVHDGKAKCAASF